MKTRLIAPDFIKGISIILMVYGHLTFIGYSSNFQKDLVHFIYTFHMPLFLIISGYFFNFKADGKNQIFTLLKSIGVPYIVFITLYLIGLILISHLNISTSNKPPENWLHFVNVVFLHPYGGYWFLHSLIIISLIFLLSNNILAKENIFLFYLAILFIFVWLDFFEIVKIRTSIYFILGYAIKNLNTKALTFPPSIIFLLIMFCILNYIYLNQYTFNPIEVINCFLIFTILWIIAEFSKKLYFIQIIAWIGQNTLIILLLHSIFIQFFKPLTTIFLKIDKSGITYSILATILTVAMSFICAKIFDYIGISSFLFSTKKIYRPLKNDRSY